LNVTAVPPFPMASFTSTDLPPPDPETNDSDSEIPEGFQPLPPSTEFYTQSGVGGTFENFVGDINDSNSESSFGSFEDSQTQSLDTGVDKSMADDILENLESDYNRTISEVKKDDNEVNELTSKLDSNLKLPEKLEKVSSNYADVGKPPAIVDIDKVKKSIASIRLKNPKLTSALDNGFRKINRPPNTSNPTKKVIIPEHSIIPFAPNSSFFKTTSKALTSRSNLSRAATLCNSLDLLDMPVSGVDIVLDVLGPDIKDANNEEGVKRNWGG
ncbi:hypothetical protein TL16_g03929, partial [Triparma laevis f. inornata]